VSTFKHLNPNQLVTMLSEGEVQIVDIRDEGSYATGHIPGAQLLDNSGLQAFIESANLDTPLVVCCYHGNSSQPAAAFLHDRGFDDVYSLDGGFSGWQTLYPDRIERN